MGLLFRRLCQYWEAPAETDGLTGMSGGRDGYQNANTQEPTKHGDYRRILKNALVRFLSSLNVDRKRALDRQKKREAGKQVCMGLRFSK